MPNVSKRPADAEKLDPQEQLKKLREALLRDAAARESDGENDAGSGAESAANRKKEAAARRFAGASEAGSAPGSGSAAGPAAGQHASKKIIQKGMGVLTSSSPSRTGPKGSPNPSSPVSTSPSRPGPARKDERGSAVTLSSLSALASLSLTSGKVSAPSAQVPVAAPERRAESTTVRVGTQDAGSTVKRAEAVKTPVTPMTPTATRDNRVSAGSSKNPGVGKSDANVPRSDRVSRVGSGQRNPATKAQTVATPSGPAKKAAERSVSDNDFRPQIDQHKPRVHRPDDGPAQQASESERSAHGANVRRTQDSRARERTDIVQHAIGPDVDTANNQGERKPGSSDNTEHGNAERLSIASVTAPEATAQDQGLSATSSGLPVEKPQAQRAERAAIDGAPQLTPTQPGRSHAEARNRTEPAVNNARQPKDGRTPDNAQQRGRPEREPKRITARSQPDDAARPDARSQPDVAGRAERTQPGSPRPDAAAKQRDTPRPRRVVEPNPVPPIRFPEMLPVSARRDEIADAIRANQVVIVSGETGSGKTTQLPKICLALGRGLGAGGTGLIGHTQPRRIAASATGRRIAEELGTPFGEVVGYKVRFTDNLSPGASVKLMTDGILLAETQTDPLLAAYDTIIIDEAHERSLNIDFLLGYLREILPRRPDLKVIVTSATIDADRFARHFGSDEKPAPVIEVSGRLYPVEVRYRPVEEESAAVKSAQGPAPGQQQKDRPERPKTQRENDRDLMEAIVDAVDELCREGPGDVLVFLPGEREIRDAAEALRKHHPPHTEILPLFARLSAAEQERVFKTSNARRIVLATNVAETSLTVPGIRYVVDTGLARVKRYSYRNKVEQLQIEPISQSSANQRAGRCGRVADGVCIRLYEEDDYNLRTRFTDPEILRSSLASVILRMKSLHLTAIETFPFLEPPPGRAIADGYQLLNELGAVDDDNALTSLGRELAR